MVTCNCLPSCLSPLKGKVINFSGDKKKKKILTKFLARKLILMWLYKQCSYRFIFLLHQELSCALASILLHLSEVQDKPEGVTLAFSFNVLIHFRFQLTFLLLWVLCIILKSVSTLKFCHSIIAVLSMAVADFLLPTMVTAVFAIFL